MTEVQMLPTSVAENQVGSAGKTKKKASWLHTILWILSMILFTNVVMGIVAYFLFFADK